MVAQGLAASTVLYSGRAMMGLSRWMASQGLGVEDLNEVLFGRYVRQNGLRYQRGPNQLASMLSPARRFLGECEGLFEWVAFKHGRDPKPVVGPFASKMVELSDWMTLAGYAPTSVKATGYVLARFSNWLAAHGVAASELSWQALDRFLVDEDAATPPHRTSRRRIKVVSGFLVACGLLGEQPQPVDATGPASRELTEFCAYLRSERGLAESTVAAWRDLVTGLVEDAAGRDGPVDWAGVDGGVVNRYVQQVATKRQLAPRSVAVVVTAVRTLTRWAYVTGRCPKRIDKAVLGGPVRRSRLVRALPTGQVQALLGACDTTTVKGRRDHAIILVLTRLGLRAGEVAGLTLDDIDWRESTMTVQGKNGRVLGLPIPVDVGEAIAAWLADGFHARTQDRAVFTRMVAPLGGLGRGGIAAVVKQAAATAGVEKPVGPHRLRHSVACAVLANGGSITETAQLLGHTQLVSTAAYARADITALAVLAPPWGKAHRP